MGVNTVSASSCVHQSLGTCRATGSFLEKKSLQMSTSHRKTLDSAGSVPMSLAGTVLARTENTSVQILEDVNVKLYLGKIVENSGAPVPMRWTGATHLCNSCTHQSLRKWTYRQTARHCRHVFATNKPVVQSAQRRLRTKGLDPTRTPGGAATNPGNSRMKHSQQLWCNGRWAG